MISKIKAGLLLAVSAFVFNANAQNTDTVKVTISTMSGLQFDKVRFAVRPGAIVSLTFKNTDDMSHNLVITKPGERLNVVTAVQALQPDVAERQGFVPRSDKVLFSIPLLHPADTRKIVFKAPATEGVYPYVCTFTGHGYIMYGAMYITNGKIPAIQSDENVPPNRRNDGTHDDDDHDMSAMAKNNVPAVSAAPVPKFTTTSHPYKVEVPTIYRIFMPDAGPAAIAVNLPGNISYCWDAGTSSLVYAWSGGFLDNAQHWSGNGRPLAKILGDIFYKDGKNSGFRIGKENNNSVADFKGYRMLNKYPQFMYKLDGADITEVISSTQWEGKGLVRTFTFNNLKKDLYFVTNVNDGMTYSSSSGTWKNGVLKLSAKQAKQFSITMVAKPIIQAKHDH
jgi:azurin